MYPQIPISVLASIRSHSGSTLYVNWGEYRVLLHGRCCWKQTPTFQISTHRDKKKHTFPLYTHVSLIIHWRNRYWDNGKQQNCQSLFMNAPCCIIYSTILFDLDMMGRHLKLKTPNTPPPGHHIAKQTKCCWLIMSPKKLISNDFLD